MSESGHQEKPDANSTFEKNPDLIQPSRQNRIPIRPTFDLIYKSQSNSYIIEIDQGRVADLDEVAPDPTLKKPRIRIQPNRKPESDPRKTPGSASATMAVSTLYVSKMIFRLNNEHK